MIDNNILVEINLYIRKNYNFMIPDAFLEGAGHKDVNAFIDLEWFLQENFMFENQALNTLGINELYKINMYDFMNKDIDQIFSNSTEIKDVGLGYAENSSKGKSPNISKAKKIKDVFSTTDPQEYKAIFTAHKATNSLPGIGLDSVSDFYLKINEKNLVEASREIISLAINDLGLNHTVDEVIDFAVEQYKRLNGYNGDVYLHLTPLEVCNVLWNPFNTEFNLLLFLEWLNKSGVNPEYNHKESKGKIISSLKERYGHLLWTKQAKLFYTKKVNNEINRLNIMKETIKTPNDLSGLKKSWELSFILNDKELRNKLGLNIQIALKPNYKENKGHYYSLVFYYEKNNKYYLFKSRINGYDKIHKEVKLIESLTSGNKEVIVLANQKSIKNSIKELKVFNISNYKF